ncbi:uncharacterized protein RAG0_11933 [Rhynchosporium agropyri]|uniref:Uncharacterized protein n=1 Tax=Rhynchosporium agropyri TaxID=914238 RepID=A0A1E1L6F7_9HELO|nr:uncharacterized protein RAG0_11933 [Rhynchosporium agropyri]
MAGTGSRPPLSPTNTHISINSYPDNSSHASLKSTSPAIDIPLDRLRGDIAAIIAQKDETIDLLFKQRDAARRDILEAEHHYLQDKAELLEIAGLEIAKGTTHIWELRLQITRLGVEKTGLEEDLQAESFQLKKHVLDLRSSKAELEERVEDLEKERVELRGEFEENIKEREAELEELRVKTLGEESILKNQDYKIKEMAKEAEDLKTKNTGLVGEVTSLKERLNGVKRTWEDVKEGMVKVDEKLYGSTAGSKKPTIGRL